MDMQTTRQHAAWAAPLARLRGRVTACGRGVVLGALALAEAVLMHPVVFLLGVLVPVPGIRSAARQLADLSRRQCGQWCGVPIASPYQPAPAGEGDNELPGRLPGPVESAAYFAVGELLANAAKHAEADQVWIDIRFDGGPEGGVASGSEMMLSGMSELSGMLRIGGTDDGRGGANPARGTGLQGVERRLAAFDGVLAVSSPPGGPTVVNMEIPCALSSPKTSFC